MFYMKIGYWRYAVLYRNLCTNCTKGNSAGQHGPVSEQPKEDNDSIELDEEKQGLVAPAK